MNLVRRLLASTSIALALYSPANTHAQEVPKGSASTQAQSELDPHLKPAWKRFESPERFIVEVRGGPYKVFSGEAYGNYFADDIGPSLGVQLDGILYHMPRMFYVTAGASLGTINFSGDAVNRDTGAIVGEKTTLSLIPVTATASIRFDALPRRFKIPLILAARIGWEWAHWSTDTGARNDAQGWSLGPVFSGQVALDLDTFEPGGARALDEEWGINHTYLYFELFHFEPTSKSLPVGTTSWMLGLGLVF
jgi:hypothetical protein